MDRGAKDTYETLAMGDIRAAADLLRPVYNRTKGEDGYACLEVSAAPAHDTVAMVEEARRLWAGLDRPNVMIKIPATPGGIAAVRQLIGEGMNINITLIFSLTTHEQVMEAYTAGLEDLLREGRDPSRVASVASMFLSRIDTLVDGQLQARIQEGREELRGLLGQAAIATAKVAYLNFKAWFLDSPRFAQLAARGAGVQRPLWASTGTKNPIYGDLHYVEPLIGSHRRHDAAGDARGLFGSRTRRAGARTRYRRGRADPGGSEGGGR